MRFQDLAVVVAVLGAAVVAGAPAAHAGVTHYDTQSTFDALGTIDQHTNFDAFDPTANTSPGTPYTVGLLTLNSDDNVVDGFQFPGSQASRNLIVNDGGGAPHQMNGAIGAPGYDLLAFKLEDLNQSDGKATIFLHMDGGAGEIMTIYDPAAGDPLAFHGFQAPTGHYFTGFGVSGNGGFSVIGLTDFEIGHTTSRCIDTSVACGGGPPDGCIDTSHPCGGGVPEPTPWALMIMGFGAVGAAIRRRQPAIA